jgi:hypothetical protein
MINGWLQNFAYRITISPLMFLVAGIAVILIMLFATHPGKFTHDNICNSADMLLRALFS